LTWTVEVLNETVLEEIKAFPEDILAAYVRLSERIMVLGLERVGEPHLKHLRGKLWEMRFRGRDGIGRAIYITFVGRRVVVLRAFMKKTQKTPKSDMELAETRAKEVK